MEQRLGIGVVVRHPWSGKGSEDAQFLQPALQRCGTHGVAVIGMENQWLAPALADAFSQAGPADQIRCDGWILTLRHIPGHHLSTPDVDHQVEVQPDPADRGGEIGVGVGPGRPPNRTCGSHRVRLSTGSCQRLSCPWRGDATASVAVANDFDPRGPEQFAAAFPYFPAREVAAMQCSPIQPEVPLP